jgi:hypothetical protein
VAGSVGADIFVRRVFKLASHVADGGRRDSFYFHENVFTDQKQPDPKVASMAIVCDYPDLFDPTLVAQVGQYPHERVIVDIDVVQYDRVVNLAAGFLDELFYHDLFLLVLSVLHS